MPQVAFPFNNLTGLDHILQAVLWYGAACILFTVNESVWAKNYVALKKPTIRPPADTTV